MNNINVIPDHDATSPLRAGDVNHIITQIHLSVQTVISFVKEISVSCYLGLGAHLAQSGDTEVAFELRIRDGRKLGLHHTRKVVTVTQLSGTQNKVRP